MNTKTYIALDLLSLGEYSHMWCASHSVYCNQGDQRSRGRAGKKRDGDRKSGSARKGKRKTQKRNWQTH
jgi:hypothetical protein